jgi:hypothetical protein
MPEHYVGREMCRVAQKQRRKKQYLVDAMSLTDFMGRHKRVGSNSDVTLMEDMKKMF